MHLFFLFTLFYSTSAIIFLPHNGLPVAQLSSALSASYSLVNSQSVTATLWYTHKMENQINNATITAITFILTSSVEVDTRLSVTILNEDDKKRTRMDIVNTRTLALERVEGLRMEALQELVTVQRQMYLLLLNSSSSYETHHKMNVLMNQTKDHLDTYGRGLVAVLKTYSESVDSIVMEMEKRS